VKEKRFSEKREAIIGDLKNRRDHPTAQEVYAAVREKFPSISLATVYRNLGELAKTGEITVVNAGGEVHFDGEETPHYHLVCTGCGKVEDVFDTLAEDFLRRVTETRGRTPQSAELSVRCLCPECENKIRN